MTDDLKRFRERVLAPWLSDASPACNAAAAALYAAVVTHADARKKTILVTAPDQVTARTVVHYLTSFLADGEHLSQLLHKVDTDSVTVQGIRIMVLPKGTTRRPRSVVETIEMEQGATLIEESISDDERVDRIQHFIRRCAYEDNVFDTEGGRALFTKLGEDMGTGDAVSTRAEVRAALDRDSKEYWASRSERLKLQDTTCDANHPARDYLPHSQPRMARVMGDLTPGPDGAYYDKDILAESRAVEAAEKQRQADTAAQIAAWRDTISKTSPEFERDRADNMGLAELRGASRPEVITGSRNFRR